MSKRSGWDLEIVFKTKQRGEVVKKTERKKTKANRWKCQRVRAEAEKDTLPSMNDF
jgi:hypothetical protein